MSRYDDDEDEIMESEAPKRRYADDEDEAPARKAPPTRATIKDEDDDEDKVAKANASRVIKSGWAAADRLKNADSLYAQRLRVTDEQIIIKFLEDAPYATYKQHWVERSGQKSFTCIADIDDRGCPLCKAGNRPTMRFAFNVALMSKDGDHSVKSYEVGLRVIDQLKNFDQDPRQGPLSKHYWAVNRSGKGATSATNHQMLRDRDLEDWETNPLTDSEHKDLMKEIYGPEIIQIPAYKDLMNIVVEDLDD